MTTVWIKLQRGNDWGVNYYAIEALNQGRFAESQRGLVFTEGETVHFKTRIGAAARDGRIRTRRHTETVSDHGHSYPVTSTVVEVVDDETDLSAEICDVWVEKSWAQAHPTKKDRGR